MHQSFEDRDMLSAEDASQRQHHFHAPTLYHPAAGILSGVPSMPFYPTNTNVQQIPPFKTPSSPVAGRAHTFGQHAAPTFSEISTRLEGLQQQRHYQEGPSHSLFQASRTVNGPKKRQRDSDDEEGEEAVSRFRSRGLPAAAQGKPELEIPSPAASYGSTDEMALEEDGTDRDFNGIYSLEPYRQRLSDLEE